MQQYLDKAFRFWDKSLKSRKKTEAKGKEEAKKSDNDTQDEGSKDVEMEDQKESDEDDHTKDTSDQKNSQKMSILNAEEQEVWDEAEYLKFLKRITHLKNVVHILCKKVWTVDTLNYILGYIFDYKFIETIKDSGRIVCSIRMMFDLVKFT